MEIKVAFKQQQKKPKSQGVSVFSKRTLSP